MIANQWENPFVVKYLVPVQDQVDTIWKRLQELQEYDLDDDMEGDFKKVVAQLQEDCSFLCGGLHIAAGSALTEPEFPMELTDLMKEGTMTMLALRDVSNKLLALRIEWMHKEPKPTCYREVEREMDIHIWSILAIVVRFRLAMQAVGLSKALPMFAFGSSAKPD